MKNITVNANLLAAVALSQSDNKLKPYLNGVYFEGDKMVATNDHILTVAQNSEPVSEPVILPVSKKVIAAAKKPKAGEVIFNFETKIVTVTNSQEDILFHIEIFKPIEGKFPEWKRTIPENEPGNLQDDLGISDVYIKKIAETAQTLTRHGLSIRIFNMEKNKFIVRYGTDNLFSLVMGMKNNIKDNSALPEWILSTT